MFLFVIIIPHVFALHRLSYQCRHVSMLPVSEDEMFLLMLIVSFVAVCALYSTHGDVSVSCQYRMFLIRRVPVH